jgi:U3 small nucleolar RNA-associated protein 10
MATSLAAQLAQVAAQSKNTLNVKAQRSAHSRSLLFEPRVAAAQTFQRIYSVCIEGFEELCHLDSRFTEYGSTLFSNASQDEDRTQMTATENAKLDQIIESFLHLVGSRLRLLPAIKSVEWLVRRFRYDMRLDPNWRFANLMRSLGFMSSIQKASCQLSSHITQYPLS